MKPMISIRRQPPRSRRRSITCSALTLAVVGLSGCATHRADKPGVHHYLGYVRVESNQASDGVITTTAMLGLKVDQGGLNLGWQKTQTVEIPPGCQVVIVPSSRDGLGLQDKELIGRLMTQPNGRALCAPYTF